MADDGAITQDAIPQDAIPQDAIPQDLAIRIDQVGPVPAGRLLSALEGTRFIREGSGIERQPRLFRTNDPDTASA